MWVPFRCHQTWPAGIVYIKAFMGKSSTICRSSIAMFDYRSVSPSKAQKCWKSMCVGISNHPKITWLISNTNWKQNKIPFWVNQSIFSFQMAETQYSIACEPSQYHLYLYTFDAGDRKRIENPGLRCSSLWCWIINISIPSGQRLRTGKIHRFEWKKSWILNERVMFFMSQSVNVDTRG